MQLFFKFRAFTKEITIIYYLLHKTNMSNKLYTYNQTRELVLVICFASSVAESTGGKKLKYLDIDIN